MEDPVTPKIRFIKLGEGGQWEESCIRENTIRLGYHSPYHQESLAGDWNSVRQFWLAQRKYNEGAATRDLNQIRDFYELREEDIWITFHRKRMYWCHAASTVRELEDGSRIRQVIGRWSSTDVTGHPLGIENIDGRITQVQGYRGTICAVALPDYLVRKIKGEPLPEVIETEKVLIELKNQVARLIKGLWWHDFELLIDLIFAKAGWQRFSVLGKTGKDIDIDAFSPATQRRAFIQIKSYTTYQEAKRYIDAYREHDDFDEMFFVYHTSTTDLVDLAPKDQNIHLWGLDTIAALVVSSGLVEWLVNKRR